MDDLDQIIKNAGADKLKQTRPLSARWHNNMIQFRECEMGHWGPWKFWDLRELEENMLDFVIGKQKMADLRTRYGSKSREFRLVGIVEVD